MEDISRPQSSQSNDDRMDIDNDRMDIDTDYYNDYYNQDNSNQGSQ
jgi:hypothetical protein